MTIHINPDAPHNTLLARYDSLGELTDTLLAFKGSTDHIGGRNSSWAGKDLPSACREALAGVPDNETELARKLLSRINTLVDARPRMERQRHVVGQRVNMGAYVSGLPKNMIRRRSTVSDVAPIKLVMEITVSAGVTDTALQKRGAALAALAYALSKTRPVSLFVCWALGGTGKHNTCMGIVKIPTSPLSLSQALAVMGTNSFARRLSFTEVATNGYTYGGWGLGKFGMPGTAARVTAFREVLGLNPQDIFLPGGHLTEQDKMLADPVTWVNSYLDAQRGQV